MTTPRDDQILRHSQRIGALGSRIDQNPHALVDLCWAISGLVGSMGGEKGPKAKGAISDPTASQALTEDMVRRDLRAVHKAIDQADSALAALSTYWTRYMPAAKDIEKRAKAYASLDEIPACRAHRSAGLFMAAGDRYKDMCRRCGDFRHDTGVEPTPELIRALDGGRRLTDRLIAQLCPEAAKSA